MTDNFIKKVKIYSHFSIFVAISIVALSVARPFVIPLAFSILFAIVLNPLLKKMEHFGLNRVLAILLVMFSFLLLLSAFFTFSAYQFTLLLQDIPSISSRFSELITSTASQIESRLGLQLFNIESFWKDALSNAAPFFTSLFETTSSAFTIVVQIPIYTFLIMLYRERFTRFFNHIWKGAAAAQTHIDEVKNVIQNYVNGLFVVILILAVLNSVGLLLLGIQYAIFFGIFSAILTVIPYLGNLIGGLIPFLVALVTKDSAWYAFGVVALYSVIQFLEGNFITPKIMGSQVAINPLAALLSLIIGGQILGLAGVILAIPAIGILKTFLSHSTTLKPLVILIEDKPKVKRKVKT